MKFKPQDDIQYIRPGRPYHNKKGYVVKIDVNGILVKLQGVSQPIYVEEDRLRKA